MITKLAGKYCGHNDTAREELIEVGCETVLKFAAENEIMDETEFMESKNFRTKIYNILKAEIRGYALKMSERSPVFPDVSCEKRKKKEKTVFYGNLAAGDAYETAIPGEYCPVELADTNSEIARDEAELWIDVSKILGAEDSTLLRKRVDGAKLEDLAEEYGISFQAVAKRLNKIRKKLIPYGESLRACA